MVVESAMIVISVGDGGDGTTMAQRGTQGAYKIIPNGNPDGRNQE